MFAKASVHPPVVMKVHCLTIGFYRTDSSAVAVTNALQAALTVYAKHAWLNLSVSSVHVAAT
jgi:citrate synthase